MRLLKKLLDHFFKTGSADRFTFTEGRFGKGILVINFNGQEILNQTGAGFQ